MSYEKKLERANELHNEIKEREKELAAIFNEDRPKRTWTRRTEQPKPEQPPAPKPLAITSAV